MVREYHHAMIWYGMVYRYKSKRGTSTEYKCWAVTEDMYQDVYHTKEKLLTQDLRVWKKRECVKLGVLTGYHRNSVKAKKWFETV